MQFNILQRDKTPSLASSIDWKTYCDTEIKARALRDDVKVIRAQMRPLEERIHKFMSDNRRDKWVYGSGPNRMLLAVKPGKRQAMSETLLNETAFQVFATLIQNDPRFQSISDAQGCQFVYRWLDNIRIAMANTSRPVHSMRFFESTNPQELISSAH